MDLGRFEKLNETAWQIQPADGMRVPAIIYGDEEILRQMDDKVGEQICNVAKLPGIVKAAYTMPDGHWGYGFPIGGVAAFDANSGGVVSGGGVGFDISCGVRLLVSDATRRDVERVKTELADALFASIPAGLGSHGSITLDAKEMDAMLYGGAKWAVDRGYGDAAELDRIEERGRMSGADAGAVSSKAKGRQRREMGTLGSGNHYLEVQEVVEIYDEAVAHAFNLTMGQVVTSIHCGSRGLGHQIGTEYLREMVIAAPSHGLELPDRELACAPLRSELGRRYLAAMRAGINCALANRQILGHLARQTLSEVLPANTFELLFDVSHNTCKKEMHEVDGRRMELFVHRKGATRAFGPGHPALPPEYRDFGQPVIIGGSMGTSSHVLVGTTRSEGLAFSSACHGAGRAMSRHQAKKRWHGRQVTDALSARGILVRSPTARGVAEEAPGAYKDVDAVVAAAAAAGLAKKVARLAPIVCIKG